jgi:hypothetical protein
MVPETESKWRSEGRFYSVFKIEVPCTYQQRYQQKVALGGFGSSGRQTASNGRGTRGLVYPAGKKPANDDGRGENTP